MKHTTFLLLSLALVLSYAHARLVSPRPQAASLEMELVSWTKAIPAPLSRSSSVSERLEQVSPGLRKNSSIVISLPSARPPEILRIAAEIERSWSTGRFELALTRLQTLGDAVGSQEMGIGVNTGATSETQLEQYSGAGIRVGDRDKIRSQSLQIDRASESLLAVQMIENDTTAGLWAVYHSSNLGETWRETFVFLAGYSMASVSATVADGYFYVGFTSGVSQNEVQLCRFRGGNGSQTPFDDGSNFLTIATMQVPECCSEMVMGSNNNYTDDRLYCGIVTNKNALKFFWSLADGLSWEPIETGVANALKGLSYGFSGGAQLSLWISYIDTTRSLCIDQFTEEGYAPSLRVPTLESRSIYTSISADQGIVVCVYTSQGQARYVMSEDAMPRLWVSGAVDEDTVTLSDSPAVTLEGWGGIGIVYRYCAPQCEGRFVWRAYNASQWREPVAFARNDLSEAQPAVVYLGNKRYGMLYLSSPGPSIRASYFETSVVTSAVSDQPYTSLDAEYVLMQNYPNPFNPSTMIRYSLPTHAHVSLKVFNSLGQLVSVLQDGIQEAGVYSVRFDGSLVSSGLYICRMCAGASVQARKLLLVR